jgi:small subunit ribosomal protein S16
MGRRHRPFYRMNAVDGKTPRDGKILEKLGHYDPLEKDAAKQYVLNIERIQHWLGLGAEPSETVSQILLQQANIETKALKEKNARRVKARDIAKAKGKLFNKAQRVAAQKIIDAEKAAAEAAKKAAEEKAKADAAAKAAAEKAAAEAAAAAAAAPSEGGE